MKQDETQILHWLVLFVRPVDLAAGYHEPESDQSNMSVWL